MKLLTIKKSSNPDKKWMAVFEPQKTVHFGATGYKDYTLGATDEQKRLYRQRHEKDLKGDPTTAGYLSYYVLWNKRSRKASIADYKKKFDL